MCVDAAGVGVSVGTVVVNPGVVVEGVAIMGLGVSMVRIGVCREGAGANLGECGEGVRTDTEVGACAGKGPGSTVGVGRAMEEEAVMLPARVWQG